MVCAHLLRSESSKLLSIFGTPCVNIVAGHRAQEGKAGEERQVERDGEARAHQQPHDGRVPHRGLGSGLHPARLSQYR